MFINNDKGAAIPTVIMVMIVLFILGMALLSVSSADVTHASVQHKNVQAHYLARSGIHIGLDILNDKLNSGNYQNLDGFITEVNDSVAALNPFSVTGLGDFELNFERYGDREIKIFSKGSLLTSPTASDLVTLRVKVSIPNTADNFPQSWYSGINLKKGIGLGDSYLGYGVLLEGNPTSSPMGSDDPSVFQASLFYFTENIKKNSPSDSYISLRQVNNTVPLTFDGEIIYFVGRVTLNTAAASENPIYLTLSTQTAMDKISNPSSILYAPGLGSDAVGFEDVNYYNHFRNGHDLNLHHLYSFEEDTRYGIVYFGGNVYNSSEVAQISSGSKYFFFPDGINIKDNNFVNSLIPIDPDDGIIDALENQFKLSVSSEAYLWGNE